MLNLERETMERLIADPAVYPPLAPWRDLRQAYPHLNDDQRFAADEVLRTSDRGVALEGVAGSGKTTTLAVIRQEAERTGYRVEGLAPTSRAAQLLAEAGFRARTLQEHLVTGRRPAADRPHLYVLDESSLASTRQMHQLVEGLASADRVLLVGDIRQHQGVDAGRPYQQLQEAGFRTVRLDRIVRQQEPALKAVVEQLARGQVMPALWQLDDQHRIHEVVDRTNRLQAVASAYVQSEGHTLVVSPDNRSRTELNTAIHHARQDAGQVSRREQTLAVLVPRQDVTGVDRTWARHYKVDDVVRYTKGSRVLGIRAREYARVTAIDPEQNLITVRRGSGDALTYDPRRLSGVALYREAERAFAVGDRIQLTAPDRARHLANRTLGTLEAVDEQSLPVRLDSGRLIRLDARASRHLDYGYAMTSHSSQGQTADHVLIHVDTERAPDVLVNRRLAYVAVSRARRDVQIYTNDRSALVRALDRDVSHQTASEFARRAPRQRGHSLGL
jgi:ATP-dependent exoDNAse (exonuclease V) alpha subunit